MFVTFCLLSIDSGAATEWSHQQIEAQALKFLQTLDGGNNEYVLQSMSPLFKVLNDSSEWIDRQEILRGAYGAIISRSTRRMTHRRTYTNSPDDDYVIVQYDSVFVNKSKAVETVILHCPKMQECLVRDYIIN
jgi:hypothetical protein